MRNLIKEAVNAPSYSKAAEKLAKTREFWKAGPLFDIHSLSSKSKGAALESIAADLCERVYGLEVKPRNDTSHDRIIQGYSTEIKSSMTWDNIPSNWKWQQIRRQQVYDRIIFLAADPQELYLWWATKQDLNTHVFPIELGNGQHGGANAGDTYWLHVKSISSRPSWFKSMESW